MSSEKLLIEKISRGDMTAFKAMFESYYPGIRAFVLGVVGDDYYVEDITQGVFIRIWLKREQLDPQKNFKNYIYTIAKHEIADYFRSEKYYLRELRLDILNDSGHIQEMIFPAFDAEQIRRQVLKEVDKMPPQRQQVFRLSRIDGLSNDGIAEKLGISKRTVEGHLNVALKTLRNILGAFTCWLTVFIFLK